MVEELQEAAASAEAAKQEVQQLQEQAQRDAVQIAEMEHLCDTLQQDMNTAKANLAESARQRGLLQQQIQAAESARLELQQQLDEAKRDNHAREIESRQQQAELLGDVHQLQASFATLSNQLQAAGQQAGQEALSTLGAPADEAAAERIALLERELAAAKQQNDRLSADLADARDEAHLAAVAVSEHKTMLASVQEELTVAQQQLMSAQQGSMTAVLRAADNHRRAGLSRLADTEQQETQTALQVGLAVVVVSGRHVTWQRTFDVTAFVNNELSIAVYLHVMYKAQHLGHQHRHVRACMSVSCICASIAAQSCAESLHSSNQYHGIAGDERRAPAAGCHLTARADKCPGVTFRGSQEVSTP